MSLDDEASVFEEGYKSGIANAGKNGASVIKRLTKISSAVDDTLKAEVIRLVGNDDIENLEQYIKLGASNNPDDPNYFFKIVKPELLCDIIGKYSVNERNIDGIDGFDKKLEDAYDLKSSKKTSQKIRAEEVIKEFKAVIDENRKKIDELKEKLKKKKARIIGLEDQNAEIGKAKWKNDNGLRERLVNENNNRISELKSEIPELEEKIEKFEEIQSKYEYKIQTAIRNFEDTFKEKCNVDVGSYNKDKSENTLDNTAINNANQINSVLNTKDLNKAIAGRMLTDIYNMDEENMVTLINQYGYEDLLAMGRNLGPLGRTQLRNILKGALRDRDTKEWGFDISKGISKINENDLNEIYNEIRDFEENINYKDTYEIQEFQNKIEALNLACLYSIADKNKMLQFFSKFTKKGNTVRKLNELLKKFSNNRHERENKARNTSNKLREKIHVSQRPDNRPRVFIDKNKQNPIREDRSL